MDPSSDVCIYQIPPLNSRNNIGQFLSDLNSEFSFFLISFLTSVKEQSLPYYLPIAGKSKDSYRSQGYSHYVEWKQSSPWFELLCCNGKQARATDQR